MEDIIKGAAINSKGYGVIPKLVMQDRDLSITAKVIYAYLASYSGNGDCCFPSRDRVCSDLGIGKDTFLKHLALLKEMGYVTVSQMKDSGRFSHNVYALNTEIVPCTVCSDTVQSDTAVKDTNNNSLNNNSIYNNNSVSLSIEDTKVSSLSTEPVDVNEYSSQQIVDLYLEICKSLPKTRTLSTNRSKAIKARLRVYGIDAIKEVFQKAEASDFLKGKNAKNWSANLDWLMTDGNFAKVLDGKYDNDRMANYGNGGGNTGYSKQYTERTSENPNVDCSWTHSTKL